MVRFQHRDRPAVGVGQSPASAAASRWIAFHNVRLRGEGSTPVPLPPPATLTLGIHNVRSANVRLWREADIRPGDEVRKVPIVLLNSFWRRDRIIVRGSTATSDDLTGNFGGALEDRSIGDCRSVALFAEKSLQAFLEFCNTIGAKRTFVRSISMTPRREKPNI
jgi:hypothetical protein